MSARKVGKHVYIEGSGNTLASVAADINDPLYCTWDGITKTFTFFGTAADIRYLYLRTGGTLDVSDGETLQFHNATADDTRFYIMTGSVFNMSGNSVLDGRATGSNRPYYWYWYGQINIIGDGTNNPLIKGYRRIYMYETQNNDNYPNDIWTVRHVTIGSNGAANNNYCFYFNVLGKIRGHVFENITMDDTIGYNYDTYMFTFTYGASINADAITFRNNIYTMGERCIFNSGGFPLKASGNSYDGGSTSWSVLHYGHPNERVRGFRNNFGYRTDKKYGQVFAYHENDTWTAVGSNLCCNVSYGAEALFKDCAWLQTTGDAIECAYQGRAMIWSGNTFTDGTWYDVKTGGEISFVYGCDVTVNDENGNPIEDATIEIRQKEGKEQFFFTTKSNGKIHAIHDLECALLTYQSRWGNSSGNIENWSDGTGDKKHEVIVSVPGYEIQKQDVTMNQDRSMIFNMALSGEGQTIENFSQSDIVRV